MAHEPISPTRLAEIDAEIAEVVRAMAEKNQQITLSIHAPSAAEKQALQIRFMLEGMWRQRGKHGNSFKSKRPEASMFFPFHAAMILAYESNRVIGLRLTKIAGGGFGAFDETQLMVSEKISAAAEAANTIMTGGTAAAVIALYQDHVTANIRRLSRREIPLFP